MINKIINILIFIFLLSAFYSCHIQKGMKALDIYNYFEAKQHFEKVKKNQPVPANYGLSIIYQRTDNPFHNLDSAYSHITKSVNLYSQLNEKKKIKYAKQGVDSVKIYQLRNSISDDLYKRAVDVNSIMGYQEFIDQNPWSSYKDSAVFLRDSLFFMEVSQINTAAAYNDFLNKYPTSYYTEKVKNKLYKREYIEETQDERLSSYLSFLKKYPNNPYVTDAEDKVFEIETETKSVEAYENFIKNYPQNHNLNKAWYLLYETYLQNNYNSNSISAFLNKYPEYPFKLGAENELKLEQAELLPFKINGLWGFITIDGSYEIPPIYNFVEPFSEGLALVRKNDKIGYIAKTGQLKIPFNFDDGYAFHNGFAVVEKNNAYGLINRVGQLIIDTQLNDLGNINEGLAYFEKNDLYGYFDKKGRVRLKAQYTDANDFIDGKAVVAKNSRYGVIDYFGTTFIPFMYKSLTKLNDTLFIATSDSVGVVSFTNDTIIPFKYTFISELPNGLCLVEKDNKFNYFNLKSNQFISNQWFDVYPEYQLFSGFVNNYAKVYISGKGYNYIDESAQLKFKKFKKDLGLYAKYIAFKKDNKWGYKPEFDKTFSFDKIGGVVEFTPLKGLIGEDKNLIFKVYYEELTFVNDTLLIIKTKGNYGLMSIHKDTILAFKYRDIEPFSNKLVKVSTDNSVLYYNFISNKWIRKEQ